MAAKLFVVRHANVHPDHRNRLNGKSEVPLADGWQAEMDKVIPCLLHHHAAAIISSPLSRARLCGDYLAGHLRLQNELDVDLAEADFGAWDGQPFAEVSERDPDFVAFLRDRDRSRAH